MAKITGYQIVGNTGEQIEPWLTGEAIEFVGEFRDPYSVAAPELAEVAIQAKVIDYDADVFRSVVDPN